MQIDPEFYSFQENLAERSLLTLVGISSLLHILIFGGIWLFGDLLDFNKNKDLPFDVITVQLMGNISEPPAPAAPKAPVDEKLNTPDVVEMPRSEPVLPQPTPLETLVAPKPTDVIPIGKRPINQPPEIKKNEEPPPKVQIPEKPPEPKPKTPPKVNEQKTLDTKIQELKRKKEAETEDDLLKERLANLALARGRGNGTSSEPNAPSTQGIQLHPAKAAYYMKVRDIVRSNWIPPVATLSSDFKTSFQVVIEPSGQISSQRIYKASGNQDFDESVMQAIRRSTLPPLPPIFEGVSDNPILTFTLSDLNSAVR